MAGYCRQIQLHRLHRRFAFMSFTDIGMSRLLEQLECTMNCVEIEPAQVCLTHHTETPIAGRNCGSSIPQNLIIPWNRSRATFKIYITMGKSSKIYAISRAPTILHTPSSHNIQFRVYIRKYFYQKALGVKKMGSSSGRCPNTLLPCQIRWHGNFSKKCPIRNIITFYKYSNGSCKKENTQQA